MKGEASPSQDGVRGYFSGGSSTRAKLGPSKTCPECGGPKDYYAATCGWCKDWEKQPNGKRGNRAQRVPIVLELLARGMSVAEVAKEVGISRSYVSRLKLYPDGEPPRQNRKTSKEGQRRRAARVRAKLTPEDAAKKLEEWRAWNKTPEGRAAAARYREEHRAREVERVRRWRLNNPEKTKAHDRKHYEARRAKLAEAPIVEDIDRAVIIARDNSICHICKRRVSARDITLDHLVPLSKGGEHTARNLAVAHRRCNSKRGAGRLPAQLRLVG